MQSIIAGTTNKIDKAIEDSSIITLKSALGRFEREEMTPEMRMKYLKEFSQAAADLIEQREESCSVVGNWRDIAKTTSGGALALAGSLVAYDGINFRSKEIKSWPQLTGGLAVLTGGGYLLYKGLTCSTQKAQIAQAHAIEKLLKDKLGANGSDSVSEGNTTSEKGASGSAQAFDTDKISQAIESSSISAVKSALNRFEREEMTSRTRKKYLNDFVEAASEVTEQRQEKCSIIGNWWDIAKTTSGGILFLGGLGGAVVTHACFNSADREDRYNAPTILKLTLALLIGGGRLLYSGITCSAQKHEIVQAQAVEKYLRGKLATADLDEAAG